ncbi:MAG: iron-sulfur cluster assembly protein [Nitrososphaeria archaeon]|nr:iron-sulfur cluster assembly protein [Nitrososphaeria archaeon]
MIKEKIEKALENVYDPEIGVPITEMKLVDKIDVKDGDVTIEFHLSMPFCPPMFAIKIGEDIKKVVSEIEGVNSIKLVLKNHYLETQINEILNKEE